MIALRQTDFIRGARNIAIIHCLVNNNNRLRLTIEIITFIGFYTTIFTYIDTLLEELSYTELQFEINNQYGTKINFYLVGYSYQAEWSDTPGYLGLNCKLMLLCLYIHDCVLQRFVNYQKR